MSPSICSPRTLKRVSMPKKTFVDIRAVKQAVSMLQVLDNYGITGRFNRSGASLLITGGNGYAKSTLVNALSRASPRGSPRQISIHVKNTTPRLKQKEGPRKTVGARLFPSWLRCCIKCLRTRTDCLLSRSVWQSCESPEN